MKLLERYLEEFLGREVDGEGKDLGDYGGGEAAGGIGDSRVLAYELENGRGEDVERAH